MLITILLFIAGLALLIGGGDLLVRGASRIATSFGISPLVIGLTVVAFGTSSPEMAVSVSAAMQGQSDIAMGNVVGSNIFNVLFILGITAIITPLIVSQQLVRLEIPLLIIISFITFLFGSDGNFSRTEGIIFFIGIIAYSWFLVYQSRKENKAVLDEYEKEYGKVKQEGKSNKTIDICFIVIGLVLLVVGSIFLVDTAIKFANYLGVSQVVIGLTIVAAGTSLPEVATSIIAGIKGKRDIAVGNIIGSNVFNLLAVLGLSATVSPNGINVAHSIINFDIPVLIAVQIACLPIFLSGFVINRWEGVLFLFYYIAYTMYLILGATHYYALSAYSNIMMLFVIPLTAITLGVIFFNALKKGAKQFSK